MEGLTFDKLPLEVARLHYKLDRLEAIITEGYKAPDVRPPATRKEAADFLGLSLPTLDTLIKTDQLKAFNIGRQIRVNWNDLEAFLNEKGGKA